MVTMGNEEKTMQRSIITEMAHRFGMEKPAFEVTLRKTIMPVEATNEQMAAFLIVAREYDLNPFTKEIYAFPTQQGGIQPIVSIDGWLKIINSHPQFDGMMFEDHFEEGKLSAVGCHMFRKDRKHPVVVIEYMSECYRDTGVWKKYPARMLRHKATIQAARYAFGFSGIVDPDEAERIIEMGEADVVSSSKQAENATLKKLGNLRQHVEDLSKTTAEPIAEGKEDGSQPE